MRGGSFFVPRWPEWSGPTRHGRRRSARDAALTASTGPRPSPRSSARSTSPSRCAGAAERPGQPRVPVQSGPRGCGKTSSARILARSLNCEQGPTPEPCGECGSCVALAPTGPGRSTSSRSTRPATAVSTTPASCARGRSSRRPPAATRSTSSTRRTWSRRRASTPCSSWSRSRPTHLKFVFATTEPEKVLGDDPVADPPLPVPAGAAGRAARATWRTSARAEGVTVEPGGAAAGGAGRRRIGAGQPLGARPAASPARARRGVTYAAGAALLGVTDAALLDEIVDALAAGDGAAVFRDGRPGGRGGPRPAPLRRRPAGAAARPGDARRGARRPPRRGWSPRARRAAGPHAGAGRGSAPPSWPAAAACWSTR